MFRDILQPRDHVNISPTIASPVTPVGRVGDGVVVEAPFNCDYGYNISIGQDVCIGANCTILDTCEVKIGDRCILGPNVNIYAATQSVDPKRRMGSKGPSLGKGVVIEDDCWIGGNVTILPGLKVGRGSTVGAGSVVTRVSDLCSSLVSGNVCADLLALERASWDCRCWQPVSGNPWCRHVMVMGHPNVMSSPKYNFSWNFEHGFFSYISVVTRAFRGVSASLGCHLISLACMYLAICVFSLRFWIDWTILIVGAYTALGGTVF